MIAGLGIAASLLGSVLGGDSTKKTGASDASTAGFDITKLLKGESDITEDGVNTSDSVSTGSADALAALKEMTSGGIEGYFKYLVKQIREKVMDSMGVSDEQLAAMDPAARKAMEDKIAEEVTKQVAKIMGVDPEDAQKMIAAADKVQGVGAAGKVEADKAYDKGGKSVAETLSELLSA